MTAPKDWFVKQEEEDLWVMGTPFVHAFLLVGEEKAAIIDSGLRGFPLKETVEKITDKPYIVICTHGHEDHAGGASELSAAYLHPADRKVYRRYFPDSRTTLLPLHEGDTFALGGTQLEILEVPGHTAGSVTVIDTAKKRAFTGDLVDGGINVLPPSEGTHLLAAYRESVEKLFSMRERVQKIYPSHGAYPLPAEFLINLAACAAGIQSGSVAGEAYSFRPTEGVPPLEGKRYSMKEAAIMLIDRVPKLPKL